ncbi:hypothetical protein MRX96_057728 [Rhipicephalus microplus]
MRVLFYSGLPFQPERSQGVRDTGAAQSCLENATPADGIAAARRRPRVERQSFGTALHEVCQECGQASKTDIGLSLLRKCKDLEAYNANINVERSKPK